MCVYIYKYIYRKREISRRHTVVWSERVRLSLRLSATAGLSALLLGETTRPSLLRSTS